MKKERGYFMKQLKRIMGVMVTLVLLLNLAGTVNAGQNPADAGSEREVGTKPLICGSEVYAKAGEVVELDIQLKNNPGITAIVTDISYDIENLTLLEAKDGGLMKDALFVKSSLMTANPFRVIWNTATFDISEDGVLLTLTFQVNETASAAAYEIKIEYDEDDIYNTKLENVDFETKCGYIIVDKEDDVQGDANKDGIVNLKDAQQLLRMVLKIERYQEISHIDMDGDGTLSLNDVQTVLKMALKIPISQEKTERKGRNAG